MFRVNGLYGHIQRNNLTSLLLLAGFVVAFELLCLAFWLPGLMRVAMVDRMFLGQPAGVLGYAGAIWQRFGDRALLALIPGTVWFLVALALHVHLVKARTGFEPLARRDDMRLHTIVETTAIGFGLPMPRLGIMEVAERNAFACGFGPRDATLVVTRGLLEALDDAELEAVVAHEMAHIRNRDTRLMASVFVLSSIMMTFARALIWRHAPTRWFILILLPVLPMAAFWLTDLLVMVAAAVTAAVLLTLLVRFAVSRAREFVADAEAVGYTKNPQALISALGKISRHDRAGEADPVVGAMMISGIVAGWFGTHPSLDARVEVMMRHAGAGDADAPQGRDSRRHHRVGTNRGSVPLTFGHGPRQTTVAQADAARRVLGELSAAPSGDTFLARNFSTVVLAIAVVISYGLVLGAQTLMGRGSGALAVMRAEDRVVGPVACYGLDGQDPYHPGQIRFDPPLRPGNMELWRYGDTFQRMMYAKWRQERELKAALAACTGGRCEGDRARAVNRELLTYVTERKRISRVLDEVYGEPGLKYALRDYASPYDQQTVALIRTQLAAGQFEIPPKGQFAAELKLLTEKPGAIFAPCRGAHNQPAASGSPVLRSSTDWAGKAAQDLWK